MLCHSICFIDLEKVKSMLYFTAILYECYRITVVNVLSYIYCYSLQINKIYFEQKIELLFTLPLFFLIIVYMGVLMV